MEAYATTMAWAASENTEKSSLFRKLQQVKDDADQLLAILDGVLMRDADNVVKGVCKNLRQVDPEHLAVSVEHAVLLNKLDHAAIMLKEFDLTTQAMADSLTIVKSKNAELGAALQKLML